MRKFKTALVIILAGALAISCQNNSDIRNESPDISQTSETNSINQDECITSFDQFAYIFPEGTPQYDEIIEPLFPWELISTVPNSLGNFPQIVAARNTGDDVELWISGEGNPLLLSTLDRVHEFYLYRPKNDSWERISADVGTSFVGDIFVTEDGAIWGRNIRPPLYSSDDPLPMLSKFDEETRRFEYAPGVIEIPFIIEESQNRINNGIEIILAEDDIFWFFVYNDGIFSFDPSTSTMVRHIDLPGIEVAQAVESSNGDFYFYQFQNSGFNLQNDIIYQFIPGTGELIVLTPPSECWPIFSGIEIDSDDNLWLGSIGYVKPDGSWILLFQDVDYYFDNIQRWLPKWAPPRVVSESSDGRIWFMNYHDTNAIYEGVAWYDPVTETGCQFTNIASRMVEDADQIMWIVTNGNLYKYNLVP